MELQGTRGEIGDRGAIVWILSALIASLAAGVSFALAPLLQGAVFPFFLLAVAFAAWLGGRGPALFSLLCSMLFAAQLVRAAPDRTPGQLVGPLLAFGLAGLGTTELIVQQRRRRLAESEAAASGAEADRLRQMVEKAAALEIRQQRAAMETIRRNEERFRMVLDAADAGLWDVDLHAGTAYLNERFLESLGYRREQAPRTPADLLEFVHPDDRQLALQHLQAHLQDGTPSDLVVRLRHAAGHHLDFNIRGKAVVADGLPVRVAGTATDVTVQRRAAASLELVAEVSRRLAASLELDGQLGEVAALCVPLLGDAALVEIEGIPEQGAAGDPALVDALRACGRSESWARAERRTFLARGDALPPQLRAAGVASVLCAPIAPLHLVADPSAPAMGWLGFAFGGQGRHHDATDRMRAGDLADRIALVAARGRAWSEAQAAIRLRDDFLSIASHELLTPLTPLQTRMQLLRRQLREVERGAPLDAARLGALIDGSELHLKRFATLVRTLLDASRLTESRVELAAERLDLAALVREVVERMQPESQRSGSTIALHTVPVPGRWDRVRLEQVVTNLLSNAFKYGEGRPVDVELFTEDHKAVLLVRDRGIGVAPEDRQRIFGRFERAVSARHFGGLGLGLYLVQQIVAAHDGVVLLESGGGSGTTFRVELPVTA